MKKIIMIMTFAFVFIAMLYQIKLANAEASNFKKLYEVTKSQKHNLSLKHNAQSSINLIMINEMCRRDQSRLKKNKSYLELIDKIN
jgi:hypothetical protein